MDLETSLQPIYELEMSCWRISNQPREGTVNVEAGAGPGECPTFCPKQKECFYKSLYSIPLKVKAASTSWLHLHGLCTAKWGF